MAFPTIPTVGAGRLLTAVNTAGGATTTFPNLSSLTKQAGDLLIAIIFEYDGNSTNAEFSSWGGGFTEFGDFAGTATLSIGCAYKVSNGSETGTFTVTTADTSANDRVTILMSIPGAHASTAPEAGGYVTGTNANGNAGSLDPAGWGTEDTLWIVAQGCGEDATTGSFTGLSTTPPTNYGSMATTGISADVVGGLEGGVVFRQNAAGSEDPSAWTNDTSNTRVGAITIAVRPTPVTIVTPDPIAATTALDRPAVNVSVAPAPIAATVALPKATPLTEPTHYIAGLAAQWDASKIPGLSGGASMTRWDDSFTSSRHLTTVDGTVTYETSQFGSLPGVRCNPGWLRSASFGPLTQPTTIFLVLKLIDTAGFYILMDSTAGATDRHVFAHNNATGDWEMYAGASAIVGGTPDTSAHVFTVTFNGASSSLRIDGVEVFTGDPGSGGLDGITLGADVNSDGDSKVVYGEVLPYDALIDSTDRSTIEAYLATKWIGGGGNATVTPDPIAAVAALARPAVNIGAGPATTAATTALDRPAVNVGASPAAVAATTALDRPAVHAGAGPAVTAIAAALDRPAVNIGAGPATAPLVVSLPQATPVTGGNATVTPDPLVVLAAFARPAVHVGAGPAVIQAFVDVPFGVGITVAASPAALPAVADLIRPAVSIGAGPATVPVVVALPTPTISAGGSVNVTPDAIAVLVALARPAVNVGAGPAAVLVTVAVVQPAVNIGAGPAVIPLVTVLPTPTIQVGGGATVTPDPIAALAALARPAVSVSVGPAVFPIVAALPQSTIAVHAVQTPATIAVVAALVRPNVHVSAGPAAIAVVVDVLRPERVGLPFEVNINPTGPILVGLIVVEADALVGAATRPGTMTGGIG
jgi:hypothetical protein